MGFLNIIKGAYPSLQQIDRSLPVASGETGITRGSSVYEDNGEFKLAGSDQAGTSDGAIVVPGAYTYYALMGQDNLTAGMAGTVGQGVAGGKPVITGLGCSMPMEVETDQYAGTPAVGNYLTLADDGKVTALADASGNTAYGLVTQAPKTRWANDAVAVAGWRTGNKVNVIRFRTMYVPGLKLA